MLTVSLAGTPATLGLLLDSDTAVLTIVVLAETGTVVIVNGSSCADKRIGPFSRWIVASATARAEIAAVRRHRVNAFALTSGNLTAAEQAERFVRNGRRIEMACAQPGPLLYAVHAKQIVRIFP